MRFSKSQKHAVALVQGVPSEGMEADHIHPQSKGGETTVENCQLLSGEANKKKGATHFTLRKWQQRFIRAWDRVRTGEVVQLNSLRELIASAPLKGWGEDPKRVEAIIRDDPEALTLFREVMKGNHGGNTSIVSNINNDKRSAGTTRSYTLSRLQRQAPELFKRVCDGEMSANAAAIEAGFRKKDTPLDLLHRAWKKATAKEKRQFLKEVRDG